MYKNKCLNLSLVVAILLMIGLYEYKSTPKTIVYKPIKVVAKVTTEAPSALPFNKTLFSNNDANSIWVVINKAKPISPLTYIPINLVTPNVALRSPGNEDSKVSAVIESPLEDLFSAAKSTKLDLMLTSGYRSYDYQTSVYNAYVTSLGEAETNRVSAKPGHSEHQTGFAVDIEPVSRKCELDDCFGSTPEGIWLTANAYKYGFIIRYTADKVNITGYSYEPWHIRYVGVLLSSEMHKEGIQTLEEFFNVSGGSNYN